MSDRNVPIIPLEVLFGNPEKNSPLLSPDGKLLAFLAPEECVMNIWLQDVRGEGARSVTHDRGRGIHQYWWAYDNKHLLYPQDVNGDENWRLHALDIETGIDRDLTPFEGAQAHLAAASHRFPGEVLVAINNRDPHLFDIHRLNLASGELTLEVENTEGMINWVADRSMRVRAGQAPTQDGGTELRVRDTAGDDWRTMITWGPEDEGGPCGWTEDGRCLYIADNRGSNTLEMRLLDALTGEMKTLASNPELDTVVPVIRESDGKLQAAGFCKHKLEWMVLDPDIAEDFELLAQAQPGQFRIIIRDLEDRQWIVLYDRDVVPPAFFLYDRPSKKLDFLFVTRPALEGYTLAEMRPLEIKSRDGLTLHCYLTLPPKAEEKGLPVVLNVHGGPWFRDRWGYDPEAQWLANRGYACLQVNFRGSTGFGRKFLTASYREWGGKMHDDLIDAVNWVIEQGIADPKRVAIYGGSYGGYAALVGAAFTPDVFKCAVDIVGPSNLHTFLSSIPPYWEPVRKLMDVRVGRLKGDEEFLASRSPLFKADQIRCPMLIAQGANDPRVKQAESEQIVSTLREKGKPVEYMLFEDEGHGFVRPENRLKFYAAAERFLAEYL